METILKCDTRVGIEKYLSRGLAGLNDLKEDRSHAGYVDHIRLNDWTILGRWTADSCGNFSPITKIGYDKVAPKDVCHNIPDVVSCNELRAILKEACGKDVAVITEYKSCIPRVHIKCPECNQGWTIDDCHDTVITREDFTMPLGQYVGQRLDDVQKTLDTKTDGVYRFCSEIPIRNDKWIDTTPHPDYDVLKMNERGIIRDSPMARSFKGTVDLYDDYIISEGDEGFVNIWRFRHQACHEKKRNKDERKYFAEILTLAGYRPSSMLAIKNEYCDCESCGPWFIFLLNGKRIKIGQRKSVINIDWSDTVGDYASLFKDEGVTVGDTYVHAWGKDKAVEYLTKIRKA